jgi:hypothetical protein
MQMPKKITIHVPPRARDAIKKLRKHSSPNQPGRTGPTFSSLVIQAIIEFAKKF